MNKADLVRELEKRLGSRRGANDALEAVLDTIVREVVRGGKVSITGFGTFDRVERAARTGRNPHTGTSVRIPKSKAPRFRAGTSFKSYVKKPNTLPKSAPATGRAAAGGAVGAAGAVASAATAPVKAAARTAAAAATAPVKAAARVASSATGTAKKAPAKNSGRHEGDGEEGARHQESNDQEDDDHEGGGQEGLVEVDRGHEVHDDEARHDGVHGQEVGGEEGARQEGDGEEGASQEGPGEEGAREEGPGPHRRNRSHHHREEGTGAKEHPLRHGVPVAAVTGTITAGRGAPRRSSANRLSRTDPHDPHSGRHAAGVVELDAHALADPEMAQATRDGRSRRHDDLEPVVEQGRTRAVLTDAVDGRLHARKASASERRRAVPAQPDPERRSQGGRVVDVDP